MLNLKKTIINFKSGFLIFVLLVSAASSAYSSQEQIIAGVYYLISRNDPNKAEEYFRSVILSGDRDNIAEAFYFLGKIYYDKVLSGIDVALNVGKAKAYLNKSDEYGIVYNKLHPPLLEEINGKYPDIPPSVLKLGSDKAKAIIEINDQSKYQINSLQVNREMGIERINFSTNKEIELHGGTLYKMKPDIESGYNSIYRSLIIVVIGIAILLVRD